MRCWGSLFTPQALSYRAHFGVPMDGLAMAVVVQEMVSAEAAGVMITLDPVNGDRSAITIESSFGLGLAVVGGEVTPDRFVVDKVTYEIRSRSIGPKAIAYRFDAGSGGVVITAVSMKSPSLAFPMSRLFRSAVASGALMSASPWLPFPPTTFESSSIATAFDATTIPSMAFRIWSIIVGRRKRGGSI